MCLWFVCKQSDENHSVHGCPFLAEIFWCFFFMCDDCILKSTTAWLLKLSVLYIHSFMHIHNTTFQIKTVLNNVLFSTEVHNPLHVHLLAQSHIYIYYNFQSLFPNKYLIIAVMHTILSGEEEKSHPYYS